MIVPRSSASAGRGTSPSRDRALPSLRVAVTPACNMQCIYCPSGMGKGEHRDVPAVHRRKYDAEGMQRIVNVFSKMGSPSVRITGGEPLLPAVFERVPPLVEAALDADVEVRINTNGTHVEQRIRELTAMHQKANGKFKLSISIDSLDESEFSQLTRSSELQNVIRAARLARDQGIPVIINMVLAELDKLQRQERDPSITVPRTTDRVYKLVRFCIEEGFDLKVLDLNWYDRPGKTFWEIHYSSMISALENFLEAVETGVLPKFEESKIVRELGNYGIPMPTFWFESPRWNKRVSVTFKNSEFGTTYNPWCDSCRLHPSEGIIQAGKCQEGLYQPVLTTNKIVTACRHKETELAMDFIERRTDAEIREGVRQVLTYFTLAYSQVTLNLVHALRFPRAWALMKPYYDALTTTPGTKILVVNSNARMPRANPEK